MTERRIIGSYELLGSPLGAGGQGEVYRARQAECDQYVAIKLFRMGSDDGAIEVLRSRVSREVAALRDISHPSVVRVLDSGEHLISDPANAGYLFIVYELIAGMDLSAALQLPLPPTAAEVGLLLRELACGLIVLHDKAVLHRDIKPSNVRLRDSAFTAPVLVDFGCVKVDGSTTLTGSVAAIGTWRYMAPEARASAREATSASDQFSLAVLAVESLSVASDVSYDDACSISSEDLLMGVITERFPNVALVLQRALSRRPVDRFPLVASFQSAFQQAAENDGLLHGDPSVIMPEMTLRPGESLQDYFSRLDLPTVDKRYARNGNLWVIVGFDEFAPIASYLKTLGIKFTFAANGGQASWRRPSWFSRSTR